MDVPVAQRVLFITLCFILPLPAILLESSQLIVLPPVKLITSLWHYYEQLPLVSLLLMGMQSIIAVVVVFFLASFFAIKMQSWEPKIRGSIVGLSLLSLLIVLASFNAYKPLIMPAVSLLNLY